MASKTLNVNMTNTIATIQSSHPWHKIWLEINVSLFVTGGDPPHPPTPTSLTKMLHYNKISPMSQKETKGRLIVAFFISSVTQLKWEAVVNRLDYLHYMH